MSVLSRLKVFANGKKASPDEVNTEFDNILQGYNSHISAAEMDHPDKSVTEKKLANQAVSRRAIQYGAVGTTELDPSILSQPTTQFGQQAKFALMDAQFKGNSVNITKVGAFNNGSVDVSGAIQNLIDNYATNEVAEILIPYGNFRYDEPIILSRPVKIKGLGPNSCLYTNDDTPLFKTAEASDKSYESLEFENFLVDSRAAASQFYHFELLNAVHPKFVGIQTRSAGLSKSDVGGIKISHTDPVTANFFMTVIDKCWLRDGSIVVDTSDVKIQNSWIWSDKRSFGVQLTNAASNVTLINSDIIPSYENGGLWVNSAGNLYGLKVIGCHFDGSYDDINTGHGINAKQLYGSTIQGNYFMRCKKSGIFLSDSMDNTIQGNFFINNNREDNGWSDIVVEGKTFASSRNTVVGNSFRRDMAHTNKGLAIEEKNSGFNPDNNIFALNVVDGTNYYAAPTIKKLGSGTRLKENTGSNCKTENSGIGVIASGNTTVIVPHGLSYTPGAKDITLTPTNSLGNAKLLYVTTIDATNFVVRTDVDPGATTATFAWNARITNQ
jgi:parallel beta-helix repeat protein